MTDKDKPQDWPGPDDLDPGSLAEMMRKARAHGVGLLGPQAQVRAYDGIAGFMSPEEVRAVAADSGVIATHGTPHFGGRRLAIGVLVSWKTLNGQPAGQPSRYPKLERVREIIDAAAEPYHHKAPWQPETEGTVFDLQSRCLRIIHYNTREPNLLAQLDRLCEIAGPNLDGFQLNMVWPPEEDIRSWAQDHPTMRIILQVNRSMFSNVARKPQLLTGEIARRYYPWITDILFDMSSGTGAPADLDEASAALVALYEAFGGAEKGGLGIGLAGGLDPVSVWNLKPLFERWPDLSIDAEGRLRDKNDAMDCEKAREYVRRAHGVMPLRAT